MTDPQFRTEYGEIVIDLDSLEVVGLITGWTLGTFRAMTLTGNSITDSFVSVSNREEALELIRKHWSEK